MRKVFLLTVLLSMAAILFLTSLPSAYAKPRIAVVDFENKAGGWGGWRLGNQAADMLTTEIVKTDKYSVMEREKLDAVLKEQNLGQSGRVDPSTAAKIGKILGVDVIVTGAVTEFGKSEAGGGGWALNIKKDTYAGVIDARMIRVNTGEIIWADTAKGSSANVRVRVKGYGGGKGYDEKIASDVLRDAVKEMAKKIGDKASGIQPRAAAPKPSIFKVAKVEGDKVWLNAGKDEGISEGDSYSVYRKGEEIVDPDTGTVLGAEEERIGSLKVTKVKSKYAIAEIVEGSDFQTGDIVK